jgi:hypothetical protein
MNVLSSRLLAAGLLGCSLLTPAAVSAAQSSGTGTVVGTVTCGQGAQEVGPNRADVSIEGIDLSTQTADGGKFTLVGVPAAEVFTVEAVTEPGGAPTASRIDVSVTPGETLDIGAIDLGVCIQPAPDQVTTPDVQQEDPLNRDEP